MSLDAPPPTTRLTRFTVLELLYIAIAMIVYHGDHTPTVWEKHYISHNAAWYTWPACSLSHKPIQPAISPCTYFLCITCDHIILYRGDKRNFVHWWFFSWSIYLSPCSMRGLFYLPWHVRCGPDLVKSDPDCRLPAGRFRCELWTMNYEPSLAHQASPRETSINLKWRIVWMDVLAGWKAIQNGTFFTHTHGPRLVKRLSWLKERSSWK